MCTVAPIPGETKIWQYITLMKRIYLIDCPGVVPPSNNDSPEDILFRGVVRVENVEHPAQYIDTVLQKTQARHVERLYEVRGYETATQFLELLARKAGRLLKGGEPDVDGVAKMVLNDFLRGKLPWFTPPPGFGEGGSKNENENEVEKGGDENETEKGGDENESEKDGDENETEKGADEKECIEGPMEEQSGSE